MVSQRKDMPELADYLAGAILANGLIWIWALTLASFRGFFSRFPPILVADISYLLYLTAGGVSSYLVSMRASTRHLIVSLKVAALSWLLSLASRPTLGLALVLLACFTGGGIAGGYLALRRRMRSRRSSSENP
jgi:hypothetical protein